MGQDPIRRMKILLFGKGGQVGWELQRSLVPMGEVIALDRRSQDRPWRSRRTRAFAIWQPADKPAGMGMQNTSLRKQDGRSQLLK